MEGISRQRLNRLRCCCAITGALGLFLILMGATEKRMRPAFQLDVVLTDEQLQDEKVKEQTYAILEKLAERSSLGIIWVAFGIPIAAASVIGLLLLREGRAP
jgi:hypothetical protein